MERGPWRTSSANTMHESKLDMSLSTFSAPACLVILVNMCEIAWNTMFHTSRLLVPQWNMVENTVPHCSVENARSAVYGSICSKLHSEDWWNKVAEHNVPQHCGTSCGTNYVEHELGYYVSSKLVFLCATVVITTTVSPELYSLYIHTVLCKGYSF